MAEPLSLKRPRQRSPIAKLLQSPTSPPFFLGSSDDQLERAHARAAANRRRIAMAANPPPPPPPQEINQKNTWELKLIDHLSEVVSAESENNKETNFEKATCTLEASVRI